MNRKQAQAYDAGRYDRRLAELGYGPAECPYEHPGLAAAWAAGFNDGPDVPVVFDQLAGRYLAKD